jgi:hypothetical protein
LRKPISLGWNHLHVVLGVSTYIEKEVRKLTVPKCKVKVHLEKHKMKTKLREVLNL